MAIQGDSLSSRTGRGATPTTRDGRPTTQGVAQPDWRYPVNQDIGYAPTAHHPIQQPGGLRPITPMPATPTWKRLPSRAEKAGLAVGTLGFFVSMVSSQTSTANGRVTHFSYTDVGALVAGLVVVCLGAASMLALSRTLPSQKRLRIGFAVLLLGLGGVHIARGVGAFASPERSSSNRAAFSAYNPEAGGSRSLSTAKNEARRNAESNLDEFVASCKAGDCKPLDAYASARCPGDAEACGALGVYIHYLGARGKADVGAAKKALTQACDRGSRGACGELDTLFDFETISTAKAIELAPFFHKACGKDNPVACFLLGVLSHQGYGIEKSLADAERVLAQGCELEHGEACFELGILHTTADATNDAERVFAQGCVLDNGAACNNLGALHRKKGANAKAHTLYEKACALDNALGCSNLSFLFKRGIGAEKNLAVARKFLTRACELKHGDACNDLGVLDEKIGAMKKARALYSQACALMEGVACANLASMLEHGHGGPEDIKESLKLAHKACRLEYMPQCDRLQKACAKGNKGACLPR